MTTLGTNGALARSSTTETRALGSTKKRPSPLDGAKVLVPTACLEFFLIFFVRSLFRDNIQVVLLQESKIFTGFTEFTFFHTFTNVPVDVCSLRVHHVVFLAQSFLEDSVNSNVVSDHDGVSLSVCHVIIRNAGSWDVVQTNLETSWAPLDEGDLSLSLHPLHGAVGDLGLDGTSVVKRDGHILVFNNVEVSLFYKEAAWL